MDCTMALYFSLFHSVKWPKLFNPSPGSSNRLTVKFYNETTADRVKCPYNNLYAEIKEIRRTEQTEQTLQAVGNLTQEHQHQETHVIRKKTISPISTFEQYKENVTLWSIFKIEDSLDQAQMKVEELINETLEQTEKISQEAKITRQISYCENEWYLEETAYYKSVDDNLFDKIDDPSCQWPTDTVSFRLSDIENCSLNKYHLNVLSYIDVSTFSEKLLEKYSNIKSQPTNIRFVHETKNSANDIAQEKSLLVEKFFCEDSTQHRQEIVQIFNDCSWDEEPLQEALDSFICEFKDDGSFETNTVEIICELQKYHNDFSLDKELVLKEKLFPLKTELTKTENKLLYHYLLDGALKENTDSKLKFENEIARDKFLRFLYLNFVKEFKKRFNWEYFVPHFSDNFNTLMYVVKGFIMDKGPFSVFVRELLSYHYDVNILMYKIDESKEMVLVSNHNPRANNKMYILLKKNKFFRLYFESDFARLVDEYRHLGEELEKIMFHLCSFSTKEHIYEYISKNQFISNDYSSLNSSVKARIKVNQVVNQEMNVKTISEYFKSQEDIALIKSRLEKLKAEFIGYENLLHYMALHFEVEGKRMTVKEFCFVINQILNFSTKESEIMPLVCWIIASKPQQLWLFELALLKLELYCKRPLESKMKMQWRKYIIHPNEKNRLMVFLNKLDQETYYINVQDIDNLLYLMSNVPKALMGLENVNINEWKYHLKDRYWAHKMKNITNWSDEELKILSFYLITWENSVGTEHCKRLVNVLIKHANDIKTKLDKDAILTILKSLNNKEVCFNIDLWEKLSISRVNEWQKIIDNESINTGLERTLEQLIKLIKNSGNTSENILAVLAEATNHINIFNSLKSSTDKLSEQKLRRMFSTILDANKGVTSSSLLSRIKSSFMDNIPNEDTFDKMLNALISSFNSGSLHISSDKATNPQKRIDFQHQLGDLSLLDLFNRGMFLLPFVELCIELQHKIKLRDTQKLTVLTFLKNTRNTLAQVSTGEGKSLIVVATAIIKALSNQKVNIITSSKVLAERDAEKYKDIYEFCGLQVGHNCSEVIEERKKTYSNCQVIYGDLANFQRDYLLDRVYDKNILGDCTFETVIVDEVDSMILDKGNNVLYLSHDVPGLDKLEPVFIYIWKLISKPTLSEKFEKVFSVKAIKDNIMYEIFGILNKEDIKLLDTSLTDNQVNKTWEYLINNNIIDYNGKVLKDNIGDCKIDDLPEICVSKEHLKYLLKKVIDRENILSVPNYLKPFVEYHLDSWIKSGINAISMENGRDYVVDVDRSGTSPDRNPIITILDKDTGTDLVNSQWDEALHQFLQIKHGCKLLLMNLKAVFVANVSFLKLYKNLYGLTGTLGSTCERESLKEMYDVDFVTIPTAKIKNFSEEPSIVCSSTDEWAQKIYDEVCYVINKHRSALIVCETIKDVLLLKQKFNLQNPQFVALHIYTRDYECLNVAKELQPGAVIISTNLAGRGTDIKLSQTLIANGGLFVCLSFLPSNYRIEEQAYGRAARNGEPGTAQLIFRTTRQSTCQAAAKVIDLKKQRDINELKRLDDIKDHYETQIKPEEKLFEMFRNLYETLKQMKQDEYIKPILLQSFLDQWTFWLDQNHKCLSSSNKSFETFISAWSNLENGDLDNWSELIADPTQLVKLGLVYLKKKDWTKALSLFDKIIKQEPNMSETAHYYRVCAVAEQKDLSKDYFLEDLRVLAKKLKARADSTLFSAFQVDYLKDKDNFNVIQIESFKEQQTNISSIYNIILESVQNITGFGLLPDNFTLPTIIGNHTAKNLYNNLIKKGLLTKPEIKTNVKLEELHFVKNYGLSPKIMSSFIKKYEGNKIEEKQFLNLFKKEYIIPSREIFWEEMVNNKALSEEEVYVFIDMQEFNMFHPSLCQRLTDCKPDAIQTSCLISNNKIWLYHPEEVVLMKGSKESSIFKQDQLIQLIGVNMYQLLESENLFLLNKMALLDPHKECSFNHFDTICKSDFENVEICEETAKKIIEDLLNQGIIKENPSGPKEIYYLVVDAEEIEHIKLTRYKAYSDDVKSLMKVCFAFRIALEKLRLLSTNLCKNIHLPIPVELHEKIVFELAKRDIVKKSHVNKEKDVEKTLDGLYPKTMDKAGYTTLLSKVLGHSCGSIVDDCIENKWLLLSDSSDKYSIGNSLKGMIQASNFKKEKDNPDKHTILTTFVNHLTLIESLNYVKTILKQSKGLYIQVETPSFSLTPLIDELHEQKLTNEIGIFVLNGFDQIITLVEKKYTLKTKCNILFILIAGVCQIAIGVALEILNPTNPLAVKVLAEGINDLIYAVSCIVTGYCSLTSYWFNKLISIATTSLTKINKFVSSYGKLSSGRSFKNIIKESCEILQKSAGVAVSKTSVRIVQAISYGALYASVDKVVNSQLEKISLAITEEIYSKIDQTVQNHSVNRCIEHMFKLHGIESEKTIDYCFSNHVQKSMETFKNNFSNLVNSLTHLIKQCCNFSKFKDTDTLSYCLDIVKISNNVIKGINNSKNLFEKTENKVNDLLDLIQNDLENKVDLDDINSSSRGLYITQEHFDQFMLSVNNKWTKEIKKLLSDSIEQQVLAPVVQFTSKHLVTFFSRAIYKNANEILELHFDKSRKNNIINYKKHQEKTKRKRISQNSDESKYEECLLELLRKRRNVALFAEIMRKNVTVDTHFLEMCCFIIPKALKNEGIKLPDFEIVIERNGIHQRFSTSGKLNAKKMVIVIAPDSDMVTNLKKNECLIKGGVNIILTKIFQDHPEFSCFPIETLKNFVAMKIEETCGAQQHFPSLMYDLPCKSHYLKTCSAVGKKSAYQYFHIDGNWVLNTKVDVDLRKEETLLSLKSIEDHILKGFTCALNKINNHIHKVQEHLRHITLSFHDFSELKYEVVHQVNKAVKGNFHCFATHYKLIMPFMFKSSRRGYENFNVIMILNNQVKDVEAHNPFGPHILYEISPCDSFEHLEKGVKGHVLLNKECTEYSFTAKNCQIAGELILPSGFELQKTYKVLILGDLMVEGVPEVTSFPTYVARSYSNNISLMRGIADLKMFYKGLQFVVLFPGVSTSISKLSGGEITKNVADIIKEIQNQFDEVQIVVCSLLKSNSLNIPKLNQINKCLKILCTTQKCSYLETNSVIVADDLEEDGVHLNRRGLNKMVPKLS